MTIKSKEKPKDAPRKSGNVKVHFLVDCVVDGTAYKCNEFTELPAEVAERVCDNSSVEYAAT